MCLEHAEHGFSRRNFGALALGAAGLSLLPLRARASGSAEALALTCIDYRLVDDNVRFFDSLKLTNEYDQVGLAGASLAAVSAKFPSAKAAFWDQLKIAVDLHHVKKLIAVDHRDCGAYKVAFGKAFVAARDAETAQHKGVMLHLQTALGKKHPALEYEAYLIALDGTAERIV